ncbi:MAG: DUF6567 family protein [Methylomonas sp.]
MANWLKLLPILASLTGCAAALPALTALSGMISPAAGTQVLATTVVGLYRQNYKIVKANATGDSVGFSLLGLLNFKSPGYDEAFAKLYRSAGVSEGKSHALVNIVHDNSSTYFILFSLPKISVRADVIEFIDAAEPIKTQDTEIIR